MCSTKPGTARPFPLRPIRGLPSSPHCAHTHRRLHSRAFEPVRRLAERLTRPVATTVSGKGIIAESHPLCIGVLGGQYGEDSANQIVREADVVFLVGFKSSQQSTFEWTLPAPTQRTIHLDIDPYEIGKVFHTTIPLVGDAATGLSD